MIGTASKRDDSMTEAFPPLPGRRARAALREGARLCGYGVSEVVRRLAGGALAADAFVEQWVDDEEAMERADASPEVAAAWEGVPKYAEMTGTWWVTKEHVYIPPPITGPGRLSRQAWLA